MISNPAAGIDDADLTAQFQMTKRLWEMESEVNGLLRSYDSLKAQIDERRSAAKAQRVSLPEEVGKALDEHEGRITELSGALAIPELEDRPASAEPPRLSEKLSDLFQNVNGVNAAPTPAQLAYMAALEAEHRRLLDEGRRYLESVQELNTLLRAASLPGLLIPDPVDPTRP